jgi:hypothetical protein
MAAVTHMSCLHAICDRRFFPARSSLPYNAEAPRIDDERKEKSFGLMMSLNMLIETPGGFDYTGADCMGWMKEAGFRETRVEHLAGPDSMVIGYK